MFDAKVTAGQITGWIEQFFYENAPPGTKAVIGISGGKDSSVAAALCAKALGSARVLGVLMPQGEQNDINSAYALCKELNIPYVELNISGPVQSLYGEIIKTGLELNGAALINTPARVRMAALYAIAGITGGRVVNTNNLSENWIGYSSKFGVGAAGDFAPLANLTVSEVKAVGREIGLCEKFTGKVPLDGLCGKTDEENLGFSYDVLDRYIRDGICADGVIKEKINRMHQANLHKINPIPSFQLNM
jgi:NAD+ synthase